MIFNVFMSQSSVLINIDNFILIACDDTTRASSIHIKLQSEQYGSINPT